MVNFVTSSREFVNSKFEELNFSNDFLSQLPKTLNLAKPTFAEIFEHLSFVVFNVTFKLLLWKSLCNFIEMNMF